MTVVTALVTRAGQHPNMSDWKRQTLDPLAAFSESVARCSVYAGQMRRGSGCVFTRCQAPYFCLTLVLPVISGNYIRCRTSNFDIAW